MRLSADQDDPGYPAWVTHPHRSAVRIYVDGEQQNHVVTADEEMGIAIINVVGHDGILVLNAAGDEIERRELRGKIEIRVEGAGYA